jgi:hypothetical protein
MDRESMVWDSKQAGQHVQRIIERLSEKDAAPGLASKRADEDAQRSVPTPDSLGG